MKKIFVTIFFLVLTKGAYSLDPLSKVKIKANRAVGEARVSDFLLHYTGNVEVTLADETVIKSGSLKIFLEKNIFEHTDKTTDQRRTERSETVKQLVLEDTIVVVSKNRTVCADRAELDPIKRSGKLFGNVKVEQTKQGPKDIPIVTQSNELFLDLSKETIAFVGTPEFPVTTVIEIGDLTKRSGE